MQTKMQRNPHLSVQPRFVFQSGLKPSYHDLSRSNANRNQVSAAAEASSGSNVETTVAQELPRTSTSTTQSSQHLSQVSVSPSHQQASTNRTRMRKRADQGIASRTRSRMKLLDVKAIPKQSTYDTDSSFICTEDPAVAAVRMKEADERTAMYLHIKFGHQNMEYVKELIRRGLIKGVPKRIGDLKYDCPICRIASAPKLSRGGLTDTTELRKGSRFHADWIILNTESVRQFKTALLLTEVRSRRKFIFVTRSRSAPIQQITYFVAHMRKKGYSVDQLRIDEDGSLARSANFMKVCTEDLKMHIQSTGGYNSENNGMVESPIKPIKRMMRAMLIGAGLPDELWCFAITYAVYISNHRYHRSIKNTPMAAWHDGNYELHSKDLFIFGSYVYVITAPQYKKQLQARTEKDPRDYMGITVDRDELPNRVDGYFVGYASHSSIILAWDPESRTIIRAHHAYVDEYCVRIMESEKLSPHSVLLQDMPPSALDSEGNLDPSKVRMVTSNIEETNERIDASKCVTIPVYLPPEGDFIGLTLKSDETFGFPILSRIDPVSPLRVQIPTDMHRNCWIVAINSKENGYVEPITAKFGIDEIKRCQIEDDEAMIELTFCRKMRPVATELQSLRAMNDQMDVNSPIVRHIVAMPERPEAGKTLFDCLKGKDRQHWIAGLKHQYSKNANMLLLSQPLPREKLPKEVRVFPSMIACRIKEKGRDLYKFEARHCVNGASMEKGTHFDFSYSPTISYPCLRLVLAWSASLGLQCSILDVENCFQNEACDPEKRIFITAPPLYIEWFKETYPDIKLPKNDGKWVLQTINGMQGRKDAGRNWYLLLKNILEDFGFSMCPAEPALFVYYEGSESLVVVTSTDDFMCTYTTEKLFSMFKEHMEKFVPVTVQTAAVMKYLSLRIIQSDLGISIDQTHHIKTSILDKWFPPGMVERLKTADTPYPTDSKFEKDLSETLPATGEELTKLELEFGGKFNSLIGQFLHVEQATRFDLGFSCSRMAQWNVAPNRPAFQELKRMARYSATHPHCPIFYPRLSMKLYQDIKFEYEPGKFDIQSISNLMNLFVDSDHARDTKTRKSISCILAALLGVLFDWHMGKQSCIAAHSTDAEVRAYYTGIHKNKYYRVLCQFLKIPIDQPTTIWEDNQPAIDVMLAGQITGRVKHMATVIAMIVEDIKAGNNIPKKIKGTINPADIGTKPLPASTLHRHARQCRGQRFYPPANTEHGKLLQVELVNVQLTEYDHAKASKTIDYRTIDAAAYDNKEKKK